MRSYTVRDLETVVDILAEAVKTSGGIGKLLRASDDNAAADASDASEEKRGIAVVDYLLGQLLTSAVRLKTLRWFASLNGLSIDEFYDRPPSAVIDTIDAIVTCKESKDFFLQASALFKRMFGTGNVTASE